LLVEGAFLCFSQNSFQKQDCLTKKPLLIGKRKKEKKKKKKKKVIWGNIYCLALHVKVLKRVKSCEEG
jgi:hypothetical protein